MALQDEDNHIIAMNDAYLKGNQLVRFWPEWGNLEPDEVTGIQVYVNPSVRTI
jgi:hypothetical protein